MTDTQLTSGAASGRAGDIEPQPVGSTSAFPAGATVPTDGQPIAATFLLAYTGATRSAYAGDRRSFLVWCAEVDLDPLAARRARLDAYAEALRTGGAAPPRSPAA